MSWKLFGKVLVLVALAGASAFVTTTALARGRAKKRLVSSPAPSNPSHVQTTVGMNRQVLPLSHPADGFVSILWVNVEPTTKGLRVSGQARIHDVRPNAAFVWSIRVRDPAQKGFVTENRYDTQIFQPSRNTHDLNPTFDDTINPSLPPGTYKVELVLYEVPPDGVGRLSDPTVREHQLMAKNTVKVTIGG